MGSKFGSNLSRGFASLLLLFSFGSDVFSCVGLAVKPAEDSSRFDSFDFFAWDILFPGFTFLAILIGPIFCCTKNRFTFVFEFSSLSLSLLSLSVTVFGSASESEFEFSSSGSLLSASSSSSLRFE